MLNQLENIKLLNQIEKYKINLKIMNFEKVASPLWKKSLFLSMPLESSKSNQNKYSPTYTKDKEKNLTS